MKILVISHKPPYPPVDGGTIATLNMCLGMAQVGHEVTLLSTTTLKHPGEVGQIPDSIRTFMHVEYHHIDLRTNMRDGALNFVFSRWPYNIVRYIKRSFKQLINRYLSTERYDVVQLEGLYLLPYVGTIRRSHQGPIALRAHNVENSIWLSLASDEPNRYRQMYFKLLHRRLLRMEVQLNGSVDALVAISELDRLWFVEHGLQKPAITVPMGYFRCPDGACPQHPATSFAYIGALDWIPNYEGLMWFIDGAWRRIQADVPEAEFHIAGRNAQSSLAEHLLAERKIIFHGQVPSATEYIGSYPIMVVPLQSGSGIRVKIVEGMFMGRAIVCTSSAIKGIEVEHGQHVLVADTPEGFAAHVVELMRNPELRQRLAQNAQAFASTRYDAVGLSRRLTEFYQSLRAQ
ncbi:MAG: glycosyltransferase family 4 protein [Bacteroidales bacterium]|nr:glycosyltransferase family 4 protein [Bacteroidales bacterium]